jgi:hypothetical protein
MIRGHWSVGTCTDRNAKPGRVYVLEPDPERVLRTVAVAALLDVRLRWSLPPQKSSAPATTR